jgi:hypothetical protein
MPMNSVSASTRIFEKTLAGRAEILDRSQKLSLAERQVLILADGLRDVKQMQQMLGNPLEPLLGKLHSLGLLQPAQPASDDVDVAGGVGHPSDEPGKAAKALASFDAASAHLFRAKVAVADASGPSRSANSLTAMAATVSGIFYGKQILLETLDHMEPHQAVLLNRKIAQVDSEAALYYVFEQAVQAIGKRASAQTVHELSRRFDQEVCRV